MATGVIPKYADGTDTGWVSVVGDNDPSMLFTGTIKYRVIGELVNVVGAQIRLKTDMSSGASRSIAPYILADYKPAANANVIGGNSGKFTQIQVNTAGSVMFYRQSEVTWTTTENINFNLFYFKA